MGLILSTICGSRREPSQDASIEVRPGVGLVRAPNVSGSRLSLLLTVSASNIHSLEQTVEMLVTVKAYPVVSQRYREAVCVAGVRTDTKTPEWVRLFPVCFRDLPEDRQFTKYQHIRLQTLTPKADLRP